MTIKDQIDKIITERRRNLPEFVNYSNRVTTIRDFINGVNAFKVNPGWLTMIKTNDKLRKEWELLKTEVDKLQSLLLPLSDGDSGSLVECLKRVKRDYLNIGCVGPWRQGKSTVIAKLTNLSDYVIPRSKFLTCTGTTINIFNGNQVVWENGQYTEKDGNKAVVYYHSFHSICKAINDYLAELQLGSMPYASTRDSFIQNCTACYNANAKKPGSDSKLKKMLDTYLLQASQYVDSLKPQDDMYEEITSLSSLESQKRLRPLVSYYEHTDAEYKELGITTPTQVFKVLAVKKVNIYTQFLVNGVDGPEEVGKIQFVDTPGLGESKLEVADTLAKALRSELDIAICLRKVSNQAGIIPNDSYDFHKVLKQNTFGRKPENWMFYLYNKEGNVPDDILQTTFTDVNNNLANTQEQGLVPNQIVGGIKLKYDLSNSVGNHIDFIDAENESEKLQHFFLSILTEMANTISDSDNAFFDEARKAYHTLDNAYNAILRNSFWNVSKCIPTFDDREKILNTIRAINQAWIDTVCCPDTLNASINKALSQFYTESYGVSLAEVLGVSKDDIDKMSAKIKSIENSAEIKIVQKLNDRIQAAREVIFPVIQKQINQQVITTQQVLSIYHTWTTKLTDLMVNRALSFIKDAQIIHEIENVKVVIWRALMNNGLLSFGQSEETAWVEYFLNLLEEGGSDFAALHDAIQDFYLYKFDLEGRIKKIVKTKIDEIATDYAIPLHQGGNIHEAIFMTLYNAESQTKASIQSDCKNVVDGQLSIELSSFNNQVGNFEMTIIPARDHLLDYKIEFEQLIKFYNKYSADIYSNDSEASQKLAVKEWNVLKLKFIS